jgi:hypothetical protein
MSKVQRLLMLREESLDHKVFGFMLWLSITVYLFAYLVIIRF